MSKYIDEFRKEHEFRHRGWVKAKTKWLAEQGLPPACAVMTTDLGPDGISANCRVCGATISVQEKERTAQDAENDWRLGNSPIRYRMLLASNLPPTGTKLTDWGEK
jgi:hypothetical protein